MKASNLKVRGGRWEDASSVVALIGQLAGALEIPRRLSEGHVCRAMRSEGFGLLVAEQASSIFAVLTYNVRPSLSHREGCCLIEEPVVDAAHPGQGIGTASVDALLGLMEAQGWAEVSMSTMPDNPQAIAFYRSLGFMDEAGLLERHRQG